MNVIEVLNHLEALALTRQEFPNGTTEFMAEITPETARELLKANTVNRSFNKANIKKFVNNINDNTWDPTISTIKFSKNGVLLDGQHRLAAVVKCKLRQVAMLFHTGLNSDVVNEIDTGCGKRKVIDIAQIEMRLEGKHAQASLLKSISSSLNVINNTLNAEDIKDPKEAQKLYYLLQDECDFVHEILIVKKSKTGIANRKSSIGAAMIAVKLMLPDSDEELDVAAQLLLHGKRTSGEVSREDYTLNPHLLKKLTEDKGAGANQRNRVDSFKECLAYLLEYCKQHEVATVTTVMINAYFERYLDALRTRIERA